MNHITKKVIFVIVFILYFIYFVNCLPIYIHMNMLSFPYELIPSLANKIYDSIICKNSIIEKYFYFMLHKIPEWTMLVSVMINSGNMYFGFREYKKKWWYYVILSISILMSLLLLDCWWILDTAE